MILNKTKIQAALLVLFLFCVLPSLVFAESLTSLSQVAKALESDRSSEREPLRRYVLPKYVKLIELQERVTGLNKEISWDPKLWKDGGLAPLLEKSQEAKKLHLEIAGIYNDFASDVPNRLRSAKVSDAEIQNWVHAALLGSSSMNVSDISSLHKTHAAFYESGISLVGLMQKYFDNWTLVEGGFEFTDTDLQKSFERLYAEFQAAGEERKRVIESFNARAGK